ncbi:MAG: hypothetical protein IPG18_17370 [Saprospiraceae bacterium]|nr:hypothetical protein [Saprospiraceae bacterium]
MRAQSIDKNITVTSSKIDIKNRYVRILDSNNNFMDSFCKEHKYIYRYLPFEWFLDILHKKIWHSFHLLSGMTHLIIFYSKEV